MTQKRSAVLALALALALVPAAARAQGVPSDAVLRGFQPTGDYTLFIDGKPVPAAEIYENSQLPAILVMTSMLPSPVLLTPRAGTVETVHIMKVAKQPDGSVDLLADAVLAPVGPFTMQDQNVTFSVGGKKVSLNPKPPLLGLRTNAQLKTHSPGYVRTAKLYKPNGIAMAELKKKTVPVTVRVFFGSWCPHCKQHLPYILKVEDELKNPKIKFEYLGLPEPPKAWEDPEVKRLRVKGVPTGIVYVNGKEVGRIEGKGWDSPEVLLNRIISAPTAKGK
jgi:thiol-disulfide isomerase/thioredoxin